MKIIYLTLTSIILLNIQSAMAQVVYCNSGATSTIDTEITGVSYGTVNNTTITGSCRSGYNDFTNLSSSVFIGSPFQITIETGDCNGGTVYNRGTKVFIDWNQDGDFTDPGEDVLTLPYGNSGTSLNYTGSITPPLTSKFGTTTMRVVCRETNSNPPPCGTFSYGETQDYTVNVLFEKNAALTDMLDPFVPACSIGDSVKVGLLCNASNPLDSVTFNWSKNGVMQPEYTWYGNLTNADPVISVTLGALVYQYGDTIRAWATRVNADTLDDNQLDDTLMSVVRPGIVGAFTVGGPTADYDSLYKVIETIHEVGVCGNVIFNLNAGYHSALCDFGTIPGITNNASITFNSTSGDANNTFINWSSTSSSTNRVLGFTDAQNITFNNLTIEDTSGGLNSSIIHFTGSDNITFNNCVIQNRYNGTSQNSTIVTQDNGSVLSNISFIDCEFNNGVSAITLVASTNTKSESLTIENCSFNNHNSNAITIINSKDLNINNNHNTNTSVTPSSGSVFIDVGDLEGGVEIHSNHNITSTKTMNEGLAIDNINGTPTNLILIYNNRFTMGDTASNNTYTGIALENSNSVLLANNTIRVYGKDENSTGISVINGTANNVFNNIVANYGAGFAFEINGISAVSAMDNNAFFAMDKMGEFNGNTLKDLSSWQNNYGYDLNSVSVDPMFTDSTLITCNGVIDNIGTKLTQTDDVNGFLRSIDNPDPGAFEFSSTVKFSVGDDYAICNGDSVTITVNATGNDIVVWDFKDTSITNSFKQSGEYYSTLVGECGTVTDTFNVAINKVVSISNDTNLCEGETLMVSGDLTKATYQWNNGATQSNTLISEAGQYYVEVVDSSGCLSSDTIEVTISGSVGLPNDTVICEGNTVDLNPGSGAGVYVWSNGSSSSRQFVDSSSVYWVEYTDPLNCVSSDTTRVTVDELPFATFTQSQFSQSNWEFIADYKSGTDYRWSFGDGRVDSGFIWKTVNVYDTNSIYSVTLIVKSQNCGSAIFSKDIEIIGVGTNEIIANSSNISVYPNPTSGELTVELPEESLGLIELKLVDINGRVVHSKQTTQLPLIHIDLSKQNLATGIYQLSVISSGNILYNGKITLH